MLKLRNKTTLRFTKVIVIIAMAVMPFASYGKKLMPDFSKGFNTIINNCMLYRAYNDSIHRNMNDAEWVKLMERRAACFQKMYDENNQVIDQFANYFQQKPKQIPDAAYDSLLVYIDKAFNIYDLDNFLVDRFARLIMPHYEAKHDTNSLVILHHIAGVCNEDIARFQDEEAGRIAKKYLYENIEMADHYPQLSPKAARVIPLDFINYCYTLSALGIVSPHEALATTNRYEAFLQKNMSLMPEKQRDRCRGFLDRIRRTAARIHQENTLKTREDSVALDTMLKFSPFSKMKASELKNAEDSIFYYHYLYHSKKISAQDADLVVKRLVDELFDNTARLDTINEFDIQSVSNVLTISISLMEANPMLKPETRRLRVSNLCQQLVELVHRAYIKRDPFFLGSMLGQLACMKSIFRHLPKDEKADFMSELTVKAQIGTVVHVQTVNHLAVTIFDALLNHCPEQFIGMMGMKTVEELQANRSMLREWMGKAAEYHDIGKIGISPIFSNDFRQLTPREFELCHKHPELALKYLNVDSIFETYKDVALGHHKWYNGKQGYPMSFDNTASPWRACIDLVTIADCIDAATDNFDRNYRKNKNLQQVLLEFKKEAGTRYNPVMVNAILQDEELCKKLDYIVTTYRFEQLKEVRDRFMK